MTNTETGVYAINGYRANNLVKQQSFKEVLFVNHISPEVKYIFTRDDGIEKSILSYGIPYNEEENIFWTIKSPTNHQIQNYKFNLMICDGVWMQTGLIFTGSYSGGGKQCGSWEGDTSTWYFRHDGDNPNHTNYSGVAFAENGHRNVTNKLVSVLIR